ncbi:hypothetical protein R9C00_17115 [Flammeovirgaceae bacterium SG7u.111]|nr:hypothetical protein [Flammeovirgaceae bacterium SG7u.132]WPO33422.1 hypothetical protein R9C00_17115 [Flammeovirgaceae bacterium SG7u.111]
MDSIGANLAGSNPIPSSRTEHSADAGSPTYAKQLLNTTRHPVRSVAEIRDLQPTPQQLLEKGESLLDNRLEIPASAGMTEKIKGNNGIDNPFAQELLPDSGEELSVGDLSALEKSYLAQIKKAGGEYRWGSTGILKT